ncbi:MAG: TatD family hydrolase [Myxococcales bacterium]|nr:TatD family hydrolase [Myxococcales bacterium]
MGETGLDGRFGDSLEAQTAAFRAHLAFARERDLPVVLHVVRAHGAALEVLRGDGVPAAGGMMHAFSGSAEVAEVCVDLGLHVSFAGPIVNAHARKLRAAAARVPLDRLLVETDAPISRCPTARRATSPACVRRVAAAVAARAAKTKKTVLRATARNAAALFGPFEEGA